MSFFDKLARVFSPHHEPDMGKMGKCMAPPPFALGASSAAGGMFPKLAKSPAPVVPTAPVAKTAAPTVPPKAVAGLGNSMMPPPFALQAGKAEPDKKEGWRMPNLFGASASKPKFSSHSSLRGGTSIEGKMGNWDWKNGVALEGPSVEFHDTNIGKDGSKMNGTEFHANLARLKLAPDNFPFQLEVNGPSAFYENMLGKDGIKIGAGASLASTDLSIGKLSRDKQNDQQFKIGKAWGGAAAGLRLYKSDDDQDGKKELNLEAIGSMGPIDSFGVKTEDPIKSIMTLAQMASGPIGMIGAIPSLLNMDGGVNRTDLLKSAVTNLLFNRHKDKKK